MEYKKELDQIYKLIEGLYTHTATQFTEIKVGINEIKTETTKNGEAIKCLEEAVAANTKSINRLEQEVKKVNQTIATHDLDIHLLKKAIV